MLGFNNLIIVTYTAHSLTRYSNIIAEWYTVSNRIQKVSEYVKIQPNTT